jgi:hypothetical protein
MREEGVRKEVGRKQYGHSLIACPGIWRKVPWITTK